MIAGLIDTSIFVDWQRGVSEALEVIQHERAGARLSIHGIVAAELLVGARDRRELRAVEAIIERESVLMPTEHDLRTALKLVGRPTASNGMTR